MKGYKGFDKDFKCNGYQFKEGETYKHDGDVKLCNSGFHFCENPIDVLGYYNSRFAEIRGEGVTEEKENDSKRVCKEIHIEAEITLSKLIEIGIKFIFDKADWTKKENHATGVSGAASATGERGAASATGWSGAASATGTSGAASATGWSGAASATGERGAASATGERGAASATGERGAASATGERGAASVSGNHSIACGIGYECKAKGKKTCWIVLAERNDDWSIKSVKSVKVDGKKIKEDVWYELKNGKFVEAK